VPPASTAVADGVFNDIAVVGSAVAVSGATASGHPAGTWGPDGAASAAADGTWGPNDAAPTAADETQGLDGAASAVAYGTWGPDGAASAAADGTWGPDGTASAVAGGGKSPAPLPADDCYWEPDSLVGATLGAEGEETLISRGWVNTRRYNN
jgi:hypothetical protein